MSRYDDEVLNLEHSKASGKTNYKILEHELKRRLAANELTENDVQVAREVASKNRGTRTRVLFSQVKSAIENQKEQTELDEQQQTDN